MIEPDVLIVGAGPVGLTLAIDLAWRGIDVTVVETRARAAPPEPKCNHVAARTMEIFRRLGVADKVRNAGLPADYPHDISYRTSFTGEELTRIKIPCRRDRFTAQGRAGLQLADAGAAASHQPDFSRADPVRACRSPAAHPHPQPHLGRGRQDRRCSSVVALRDLDTGAVTRLGCRYLIGCDGARSIVRKAIGAELSGDAIVQRVQSTFIRAPGLIDLQGSRAPGAPAASTPAAAAWSMRSTAASAGWCTTT